MVHNLGPRKDLGFNVSSVSLDPRDGQFAFALRQEGAAVVSLLWKVDHPPVCYDPENTRELPGSAGYTCNGQGLSGLPALEPGTSIAIPRDRFGR